MEYLKIRRTAKQVRADGSRYAVPLFITKSRKYGKVVSQQTISTKSPILITGAHDSGKTRWLSRMHEHAAEIWGAKIKASPLYLDAIAPIASWNDNPELAKWWDAKQEELPAEERLLWKNLKPYERSEALPTYCADTGAVLFLDDVHKLAGRKLQIARQCALKAKIFVVASSEEQRIPPNLRTVLMRRKPQIYRLDSEASYDATHILTWFIIVSLLAIGFWEAALVMGGLKALGSGRRSTRAD